jgi:L-threonylcarbamoyladenylate synthase
MGAIRHVDQTQPSEELLAHAARLLAQGGVLVMPTDSVYGIGCAALQDNPAHERIFAIKRRERTQTLPLLIADPQDLGRYALELPSFAHRLAEAFWPGALTLVVRASDAVPPAYRAADGTVALRCPDSALVRELCRRVGAPLATTSANTHGRPSATTGAGVEPHIVAQADLTLDSGPAPVGIASTIVACFDSEVRLLREGALGRDEIRRMMGAQG